MRSGLILSSQSVEHRRVNNSLRRIVNLLHIRRIESAPGNRYQGLDLQPRIHFDFLTSARRMRSCANCGIVSNRNVTLAGLSIFSGACTIIYLRLPRLAHSVPLQLGQMYYR